MRIKFFVFLLVSVFVLPTFSAETQQSGSGSLPKPAMEFKSWQVGRGSVGSDINNIVHTSFITSTETECRFTASVGYKGGNQPQGSVSPIDADTVVWSIVDPNHGMALADGSLKHNWSGSHPSKLSGTTSFNVVGKLSVPEYKPTPKPAICRDENNHRRHERTPTHRGNTKLAFKIKFTAQTEAGQTVSEVLPLKQYNIDQVRQEYVDLNRMIPARVDPKWASQDTYDFGHYPVMLNAGLYNYHQKWVDAMNKRERQPKSLSNLAISDFTLNSGYRNPHHNRHHAGSTGFSAHMYGYALDVDGRDLDGIAGADQQEMVNAAYNATPRARFSGKYSNKTHVHADWARSDWKAFSNTPGARAGDAPDFSLPSQSTDTRAVVKKEDDKKAVKLLACGHLEGTAGDHFRLIFSCGHSDYYCYRGDHDQSGCQDYVHPDDRVSVDQKGGETLGACGCMYKPTPETILVHRLGYCPRNDSGEVCLVGDNGRYWICQGEHTHRYADGSVIAPEPPKQVQPDPQPEVKPKVIAKETTPDPKPKEDTDTDSDDDDDDDADPPVSSVKCGNSWGGSGACKYGGVVSGSSTEHQSSACPSGHTYWTCNPTVDAAQWQKKHRVLTPCPTKNGVSCSYGSYYACSPHTHAYPETKQPPVTVQTRPCGDSLSASGNHSYVSSCSETNSRGDRCTNSSGYYACTPHSHSFPSAPSTFLAVCGVHQITSSEKRSHSFVSYACSSHTYSRCLPPSSSEKGRHSYQTLACGNHSGYACKASSSHTTSKSCPTKNGQSCTIGSYYACSPHTHKYPSKPDPPKSTVKCGNSWRGSGACTSGRVVNSSSTEHQSSACSSGHTYWTCNPTVNVSSWENKHRVRTCRRSGCSNSWQACVDGWTAPRCQAKSGSGCWAR